LDVGPGTGFLLDRCRFPVTRPELTLLDANPAVLTYAARRLARYIPTTIEADVRLPLSLGDARFDSIGLSYVLHCIPSSMADKTRILAGLAGLLSPGGVLFGSTILADGVDHCRRARR
jgi:SAM-dependent methyltransferase